MDIKELKTELLGFKVRFDSSKIYLLNDIEVSFSRVKKFVRKEKSIILYGENFILTVYKRGGYELKKNINLQDM